MTLPLSESSDDTAASGRRTSQDENGSSGNAHGTGSSAWWSWPRWLGVGRTVQKESPADAAPFTTGRNERAASNSRQSSKHNNTSANGASPDPAPAEKQVWWSWKGRQPSLKSSAVPANKGQLPDPPFNPFLTTKYTLPEINAEAGLFESQLTSTEVLLARWFKFMRRFWKRLFLVPIADAERPSVWKLQRNRSLDALVRPQLSVSLRHDHWSHCELHHLTCAALQ